LQGLCGRKEAAMSTAILKTQPEFGCEQIVQQTLHAVDVAQAAAAAIAEGIATASTSHLRVMRDYEEELDNLDREINQSVTSAISRVSEAQARELLACLKFILELERIGDLLLNFVNRAGAVLKRIEQQDVKDLTLMASIVERMLADTHQAFANRDLKACLKVMRADSELDRMRNMIFLRHVENPDNQPRQESFHIVIMTQTMERAGDHVKNLAEEVCHLVSGQSIRHLIRASDKPFEEMFLDWMRRQEASRH
jgi:phosphate transport system protein